MCVFEKYNASFILIFHISEIKRYRKKKMAEIYNYKNKKHNYKFKICNYIFDKI